MRATYLILLLSFGHCQLRAQDSPGIIDVAVIALKFDRQAGNCAVSITNSALIRTNKNRTLPVYRDWHTNDFVCFLLNADDEILDTLVIRQPLKPRYEYPGENGTIGSVATDLATNEVLVRFPYSETMRYLQVSEVTGQRQLNIITKLPLSFHE